MIIKVNKSTRVRKPVKYATLSSGTISHVWYDDDSESLKTAKRRNAIRLSTLPVLLANAKQDHLGAR